MCYVNIKLVLLYSTLTMPLEGISSHLGKPLKANKRVSLPRRSNSNEADVNQLFLNTSFKSDTDSETNLPPVLRAKLHDLFNQIEKEFETLYAENIHLQDKIEALNERLGKESIVFDKQTESTELESVPPKNVSKQKLSGTSQKLKTAHRLKAQTSKIVSSFKGPSVCCSLVKEFVGHRDGVWDVAVARPGQLFIGTASADHRACIWGMESGRCLLRYIGHSGSVNSIRFHPTRDLVLTSSGDHTAHIWQAAVIDQPRGLSSDEDIEGGGGIGCEGGGGVGEEEVVEEKAAQLRTPVGEFVGHSGVVVAADWLPGGDHVVTASWDRTAAVYDVETGEVLHSLTGHDRELTHTSSHHSQRLVVTSSKDTTFRLWDFREPIHSVSVFQGHTDTVTSAVFTKWEDKVVSGSDDRSVKVWDLRNMRSPLATVRSDSGVNRLSVSNNGVVAVPHDNRHIRLYDLSGQRIARLPRTSRQGHQRMVCSIAWAEDNNSATNLFSCGFDRFTLGWSIQNIKDM